MKIQLTLLVGALALAACNVSDDGVSANNGGTANNTANNTTNNANNTANNVANNASNNANNGPGDKPTVVFSNKYIGDVAGDYAEDPLVPLEVKSDIVTTNSTDCDGCRIQILMGIESGEGEIGCFYDGPAGSAAGSTTFYNLPEGENKILYEIFETTDCDAAIEEVMMREEPPTTSFGTIKVSVAPLGVVQAFPAHYDRGIATNVVISIKFNRQLDPATAAGFVLKNDDGEVDTRVEIQGDTVVVSPLYALPEFQTQHVLSTPSVQSMDGQSTGPLEIVFFTDMFVEGTDYRIFNTALGMDRVLTVDDANVCTFAPVVPASDTISRWNFKKNEQHWVAWLNHLGEQLHLEGSDGSEPCLLKSPGYTGQNWYFNPLNMGWAMHTQYVGDSEALTTTANAAPPSMQNFRSLDTQEWRFVRIP